MNWGWLCRRARLGAAAGVLSLAVLVPAGRPRCAPSCPGAELAQQQGFNEHFRFPATRHEAIDTATTRPELCGEQILLHL